MKTIREITEALSQEYTKETYTLAPIKDIDGMDYIAWNDSADLANRVFGPLGWSNTLVSCTFREFTGEFWDKQQNGFVEKTFRGYEAVVRVEVIYTTDNGQVMSTHRDGAGFADVVPQGKKNPLDLAYKAAASDAFSRAVKQLGDYFGLFLYDKPAESSEAAPSRPSSAGGQRSSGGGKPSAKQLEWVVKKGVPQSIADTLTGAQAKAALDRLFAGDGAREVVEGLGLEWVETKAKDDLPLARARR